MKDRKLIKVMTLLIGIVLISGINVSKGVNKTNPANENIVEITSTTDGLKVRIDVWDSAGKKWHYDYLPTEFTWDITNLENYPKGRNWIRGKGMWEYYSEGELKDSGKGSGSIIVDDKEYGKVSVRAKIKIKGITIDRMVIYVDGKVIGGSRKGSVRGTWQFNPVDYPYGTNYTITIAVTGHKTDNPDRKAAGVVYVKRVTTEPVVGIVKPEEGDIFSLTELNNTATPEIVFKAVVYKEDFEGDISWKLDLEWQPSTGRAALKKEGIKEFTSLSKEEHKERFKSVGGELTCNASAVIDEEEIESIPVHAMITGVKISHEKITKRLVKLYKNGATPRLMTGICMKESSYLQFFNCNVNYPGLWMPRVSDDNMNGILGDNNDGSHVGLMQLPTSWKAAWDWKVNTQAGVNFFKSKKIPTAKRVMRRMINDFKKQNPDIKEKSIEKLNAVQIENMALVYYGPYGKYGPYYILVREDKRGVWKENIEGNPKGIAYVKEIRSLMK